MNIKEGRSCQYQTSACVRREEGGGGATLPSVAQVTSSIPTRRVSHAGFGMVTEEVGEYRRSQ